MRFDLQEQQTNQAFPLAAFSAAICELGDTQKSMQKTLASIRETMEAMLQEIKRGNENAVLGRQKAEEVVEHLRSDIEERKLSRNAKTV